MLKNFSFIFLSTLFFLFSGDMLASGFKLDNCTYTKIPFKYLNGLIIIPISINKGKPLNFLLDTGISSTVLFGKKRAEKLGLKFHKTTLIKGLGENGLIESGITHGNMISLPGLCGDNISIVTIPKPEIKLVMPVIHGAIGYQVFANFVVSIDYKRKVLTIYDREYFTASSSSYDIIPFRLENTKPYIIGEFVYKNTSIPLKLMLDTGFNGEILLFKQRPAFQNINFMESSLTRIGKGLSGRINGFLLSKAHFDIFGYSINIDQTMVSDIYYTSTTQRDGLIGNKLVDHLTVIIDYPHEKIYFIENNKPSAPPLSP